MQNCSGDFFTGIRFPLHARLFDQVPAEESCKHCQNARKKYVSCKTQARQKMYQIHLNGPSVQKHTVGNIHWQSRNIFRNHFRIQNRKNYPGEKKRNCPGQSTFVEQASHECCKQERNQEFLVSLNLEPVKLIQRSCRKAGNEPEQVGLPPNDQRITWKAGQAPLRNNKSECRCVQKTPANTLPFWFDSYQQCDECYEKVAAGLMGDGPHRAIRPRVHRTQINLRGGSVQCEPFQYDSLDFEVGNVLLKVRYHEKCEQSLGKQTCNNEAWNDSQKPVAKESKRPISALSSRGDQIATQDEKATDRKIAQSEAHRRLNPKYHGHGFSLVPTIQKARAVSHDHGQSEQQSCDIKGRVSRKGMRCWCMRGSGGWMYDLPSRKSKGHRAKASAELWDLDRVGSKVACSYQTTSSNRQREIRHDRMLARHGMIVGSRMQ